MDFSAIFAVVNHQYLQPRWPTYWQPQNGTLIIAAEYELVLDIDTKGWALLF
jgi:hypothetical protein